MKNKYIKKGLIVIGFVLIIAFVFSFIPNYDTDLLKYEEKLHNKKFTVVSYTKGHKKILATGNDTNDIMILKYNDIEFRVEHFRGTPYSSETTLDNFVFVQEKENIEKDANDILIANNFDSYVELLDEHGMMLGVSGTNDKYQGLLKSNQLDFDIVIYTDEKIYFEEDQNTLNTISHIENLLAEFLGDSYDIYFVRNKFKNHTSDEYWDYFYLRYSNWGTSKEFILNERRDIEV